MNRAVLFFLLSIFVSILSAQTPSSIMFQADSLSKVGEYKQTISLLQANKDILLDSDSTDFEIYYHLYIGNAYLQSQAYEQAEEHLLDCFTRIEKKYGKYSKEYCQYYHLLIEVYNLSCNYERLIDSSLVYLDIIENVYDKDIPAYSETLTTLGSLFLQLSQYDLSEKYLIQALELREENLGKEHYDYITTYNNLGFFYSQTSQYEKARAVFTDIKSILENKTELDSLTYAAILMQLGVIDLYTSNLEQSENELQQAKQILETNNHTSTLAYINTLTYNGELNIAKQHYSKAETYFLSAQNLWLKLGNDRKNENYVNIIADLATTYNYLSKYREAEQGYLEAIQILKETIGIRNSRYATTIMNLGVMYFNSNNYQKAEETFLEAKDVYEKILDTNNPNYALVLGNLGTLYLNTENYQLAEKYLFESKAIFENFQNPQFAVILNNLGLLYHKIGDSGKAFDFFDESLDKTVKMKGENNTDYALALLNISLIFNEWGNDTTAMDMINYALQIFHENFGLEHPYVILAYNNGGNIRMQQGNYEKAISNFNISDSLSVKVFGEDCPYRVLPLSNLSTLYAEQGNYDLSLQYILKAKEILDKNNSKENILAIYENISLIYWLLKQYENSLQFTQEWQNELIQTIKHNFSFMSTKQRENFWDNKNGFTLEMFSKNLLSAYSTPETQSLAYDNTLFSKGLLLRSSNEIRDAILNSDNQELKDKFTELQSLRQQITALESKTDSAMLAYKQTLEEEAEKLDKEITLTSADYREMKADLNMNWQDVQKNLKENEVAIEFIDFDLFNVQRTDSVMYAALLIRKDSKVPEYIPLFEKKQLSTLLNDENPELSKRIQKLYNGSNPRFYNGQKLYNLLWKPLESYLDGVETVYYSPSGLLHRVSFSAIPIDTLTLNDKYSLHLVSSTREIIRSKKAGTAFLPLQQAVAYGGIKYNIEDTQTLVQSARKYNTEQTEYLASRSLPSDSTRSGWEYLQGTEKEVVEIERILTKSKIPHIKYMGVDANEESFKNLSGQAPALLHIATHGFFLEDEKQIRETGFMQILGGNERRTYVNPLLRSGLLFAGANRAWKNEDVVSGIEDGILTAEEISQLNLSNTKLVVLSACETGLGEVQNSEGVFGLQRAFKLAGVETLVMSLWKVDDATTNDFMTAFYQSLLSGKTKLQSFKSAQQAIRAQHPNPYYWAAFVMMD